MPTTKYVLSLDNARTFVKITLENDARAADGWDFVLLDVDANTNQSITFGTQDDKGYAENIRDIYEKECGKNQYAEGEVDSPNAQYHIALHTRIEQAFGINQHKMTANGPPYWHDHWSTGKGGISKLLIVGVQNAIFTQKLLFNLSNQNISTLDFSDL